MTPADRFAQLPELLAADDDLRRRGRFACVDCRIDIGDEPFFLSIVEPSDALKVVFTQRPRSSNHWSLVTSPV